MKWWMHGNEHTCIKYYNIPKQSIETKNGEKWALFSVGLLKILATYEPLKTSMKELPIFDKRKNLEIRGERRKKGK